jgi:hypothetical protein
LAGFLAVLRQIGPFGLRNLPFVALVANNCTGVWQGAPLFTDGLAGGFVPKPHQRKRKTDHVNVRFLVDPKLPDIHLFCCHLVGPLPRRLVLLVPRSLAYRQF